MSECLRLCYIGRSLEIEPEHDCWNIGRGHGGRFSLRLCLYRELPREREVDALRRSVLAGLWRVEGGRGDGGLVLA